VSQENVELAGQVMDALGRRDLQCVIALTDPEVEWHSFFAELGDHGLYRGHDGIRQYLSDLDDAWEILRADVDDGVGVGDVAVLLGRIHYRGRFSGIETEAPAGWMLKFRDGRAVCIRAFREPEQALEALGLARQARPANLDLVRSIYTAHARGDYSHADWAHPEIEFVQADGPHPGSRMGQMPDGARDWLRTWEDFRTEAEGYRELDAERVLVLTRRSGRGKRSGIELSELGARGANLLHIRDGKVTRWVTYFDRDRALADLGLAAERDSP
jgi:ketosteroid isomerase-like protein